MCRDCKSDLQWLMQQLPRELASRIGTAELAVELLRKLNFHGHADDVEALISHVIANPGRLDSK